MDFFREKGCQKITVIIPRNRQADGGAIFKKLFEEEVLQYSPARYVSGEMEKVNDDRFDIKY